ncbi:MAG: nuclear transport factor 2 family protein [Sedimentisphaerales bacterium]|jgi:ketosteroid isomerase-like protein|nr:nuclear transport factor 2 family protein [Sedimentisphaerales bacterium]
MRDLTAIKVLACIALVTLAGCGGLGGNQAQQKEAEKIASTILQMEQSALDKWCQGDPSGYLQIFAPEIIYIDPDQAVKLNGLPAVTELFEKARGKVRIDQYELLNPTVQVYGNTAILTYNYVGHVGSQGYKWNCTQVYCKRRGKWWIVHTHWSITGPLRSTP